MIAKKFRFKGIKIRGYVWNLENLMGKHKTQLYYPSVVRIEETTFFGNLERKIL